MPARPRLELKYRLDAFAYRRVQASIRAHVRLDRYSRAAGGRYVVRSLYFDSSDLAAYVDKLAGVTTRVKPRLRAYGHQLSDTPFVSVELKGRVGMAIVKEATRIDADAYRRFLDHGSFDVHDGRGPDGRGPDGRGPDDRVSNDWVSNDWAQDQVLEGFERARRRGHLRPKVLVAYQREAYESRAQRSDPLRVTFDHRVETAHATTLFDNVRWRATVPGMVVLEIKTPDRLPPWLERVVREHRLFSEPNSKYTQAIDQAFPAVSIR